MQNLQVTEKEAALLKFLRALGYGTLTLEVKDREPFEAIETHKNIRF